MLAQPSMEGRVPPPSSVRVGVLFSTTTGTEQARSMTKTIAYLGQQPPMEGGREGREGREGGEGGEEGRGGRGGREGFLKLVQQYFRKQTPI